MARTVTRKAPAKKRKAKLPQLPPRETRLAMLYAEGGRTVSECCRIVGLNPTSHSIRDRLRNGDIGQVMRARMAELGLSLDLPLLKIRHMYDAKKEVLNPALHSEAANLAAMAKGETVPVAVELRDNESQRWAVEQHLKLLDAYPKADAPPVGSGIEAVQVVFAQMAPNAVQAGIEIVTVGGNGNGHNGHGRNGGNGTG